MGLFSRKKIYEGFEIPQIMRETLEKLKDPRGWVAFFANGVFVQIKYYRDELTNKPYELDIPLNDNMKPFEKELLSFYDSNNIEWKRNTTPDFDFIDAYLPTLEETAKISERIFREVFKILDLKITIKSC